MSPEDLYLHAVINRHGLTPNDPTPHRLRRQLEPLLRQWAGHNLESVTISGSHARDTALRGGDVDLFLSLSPTTPGSLREIRASLQDFFRLSIPRNVSLRIRLDNTNIDLVPARRREDSTNHSLWQRRTDTWLQTNIAEQICYVLQSRLLNEIPALKIWRRQALRFPSFYLELATIHALSPITQSSNQQITKSFLSLLHFLSTDFPHTRLLKSANSNNIVSDLLTEEEKYPIAGVAQMSLRAPSWPEIM